MEWDVIGGRILHSQLIKCKALKCLPSNFSIVPYKTFASPCLSPTPFLKRHLRYQPHHKVCLPYVCITFDIYTYISIYMTKITGFAQFDDVYIAA